MYHVDLDLSSIEAETILLPKENKVDLERKFVHGSLHLFATSVLSILSIIIFINLKREWYVKCWKEKIDNHFFSCVGIERSRCPDFRNDQKLESIRPRV